MRPVVMVAAVARNGVIGRDNRLLWRLRSDLKRFRALTIGKPVIMGRKTFESIGKPLPGRETVLVTRDTSLHVPGVSVVPSPDSALERADALAQAMSAGEIMVAGGGEIYSALLARADRLEITEVGIEPEGDAFFPVIDRTIWREVSRSEHPAGPDDEAPFAFVRYEKRT